MVCTFPNRNYLTITNNEISTPDLYAQIAHVATGSSKDLRAQIAYVSIFCNSRRIHHHFSILCTKWVNMMKLK